jgi:hypothetical protein
MGRRGLLVKSAPNLDEVRGHIEHWRKTRPSRGRMPPHLWEAAATLARSQGIHAVSQELHVSYDSLKAHVNGRAAGPRAKGAPKRLATQFVELGPVLPMRPEVGSTVMELVGATGSRLIVRVTGAAGADVVTLIRELYNRVP